MAPNASRDEIVGWMGSELKVKLQAPPEGGRANKALIAFLGKALGLSRKEVAIVAGEKSRHKILEFTSLTLEELEGRMGREDT